MEHAEHSCGALKLTPWFHTYYLIEFSSPTLKLAFKLLFFFLLSPFMVCSRHCHCPSLKAWELTILLASSYEHGVPS